MIGSLVIYLFFTIMACGVTMLGANVLLGQDGKFNDVIYLKMTMMIEFLWFVFSLVFLFFGKSFIPYWQVMPAIYVIGYTICASIGLWFYYQKRRFFEETVEYPLWFIWMVVGFSLTHGVACLIILYFYFLYF